MTCCSPTSSTKLASNMSEHLADILSVLILLNEFDSGIVPGTGIIGAAIKLAIYGFKRDRIASGRSATIGFAKIPLAKVLPRPSGNLDIHPDNSRLRYE